MSQPIIYREHAGRVSLEMDRDQFDRLVLMLGFAIGACDNKPQFYRWLKFVNELNAMNPQFQPYEIPADILEGDAA